MPEYIFTRLTDDLAVHQKLDDEPNDVGGLTAAELKAKFDEAGLKIQDYINDGFLPELERYLPGTPTTDINGGTFGDSGNRIQLKRGYEADIPELAEGEAGFCLDSGKLFVGDGNGKNISVGGEQVSPETAAAIWNAKTKPDEPTINQALAALVDPLGATRTFGYKIDDPRYAPADGRRIDPVIYPELAELLGDTYGAIGEVELAQQLDTGTTLNDVCWSPELELFVAVGRWATAGLFFTSENGLRWTLRQQEVAGTNITRICWSPELGLFVAVGYEDAYYALIYTSNDGATWTRVYRHDSYSYAGDGGCCWSPKLGLFVVVVRNNNTRSMFFTSSNGALWSLSFNMPNNYDQINDVCWSPELELFVAVGRWGQNYFNTLIYTSTNGITWTSRLRDALGTNVNSTEVMAVDWSPGLGKFVASGWGKFASSAENRIPMTYISTDGITWEKHAITPAPYSHVRDVVWAPERSLFYGISQISASYYGLFASPDGINWAMQGNGTISSGVAASAWSGKFGMLSIADSGRNFYVYSNFPALPNHNDLIPYTYIRALRM